ncbi:MAG: hypothetical protein KBE53_00180 [Chromatiaceae bacterium]|nr:hypothetical protein [Chromatiaceae bacterium]
MTISAKKAAIWARGFMGWLLVFPPAGGVAPPALFIDLLPQIDARTPFHEMKHAIHEEEEDDEQDAIHCAVDECVD